KLVEAIVGGAGFQLHPRPIKLLQQRTAQVQALARYIGGQTPRAGEPESSRGRRCGEGIMKLLRLALGVLGSDPHTRTVKVCPDRIVAATEKGGVRPGAYIEVGLGVQQPR